VPKYYEYEKLRIAGVSEELENSCGLVVVSCCYDKLVVEARGQFRNPKEGERPMLEVATRQRQ
jgi:hypothetical protein